MEIPKDGKSYLAWHKEIGMSFIQWVEFPDLDERFTGLPKIPCMWMGYSMKEGCLYRFQPLENSISRYMDEKGKWHELNTDMSNKNSDMKSSQKMIWYSVHDIIKNDDQWWPAPQATLCRSMEEALECQKQYKSSKITKMVIDEVTQQFVPYEEGLMV